MNQPKKILESLCLRPTRHQKNGTQWVSEYCLQNVIIDMLRRHVNSIIGGRVSKASSGD